MYEVHARGSRFQDHTFAVVIPGTPQVGQIYVYGAEGALWAKSFHARPTGKLVAGDRNYQEVGSACLVGY